MHRRFAIMSLGAVLLLGAAGCAASVGEGPGAGGAGAQAAAAEGQVEWAFTQAGQHPEKQLTDVIRSARRTLDIAIYSLTYPETVQAIRDAAKRGVAVRIITDRIQSAGKTQSAALKILGRAGIPIKINSHSGLMHLKMTVADGEVATTGSYNYTKSASTVNDEVLVVLRDKEIAQAFGRQFDRMWNDPKETEPLAAAGSAQASNAGESEAAEAGEPSSGAPAACSDPKIKGNINSRNEKIYHLPGDSQYERTKAERMFCTEDEAKAAGFRPAGR